MEKEIRFKVEQCFQSNVRSDTIIVWPQDDFEFNGRHFDALHFSDSLISLEELENYKISGEEFIFKYDDRQLVINEVINLPEGNLDDILEITFGPYYYAECNYRKRIDKIKEDLGIAKKNYEKLLRGIKSKKSVKGFLELNDVSKLGLKSYKNYRKFIRSLGNDLEVSQE